MLAGGVCEGMLCLPFAGATKVLRAACTFIEIPAHRAHVGLSSACGLFSILIQLCVSVYLLFAFSLFVVSWNDATTVVLRQSMTASRS